MIVREGLAQKLGTDKATAQIAVDAFGVYYYDGGFSDLLRREAKDWTFYESTHLKEKIALPIILGGISLARQLVEPTAEQLREVALTSASGFDSESYPQLREHLSKYLMRGVRDGVILPATGEAIDNALAIGAEEARTQ